MDLTVNPNYEDANIVYLQNLLDENGQEISGGDSHIAATLHVSPGSVVTALWLSENKEQLKLLHAHDSSDLLWSLGTPGQGERDAIRELFAKEVQAAILDLKDQLMASDMSLFQRLVWSTGRLALRARTQPPEVNRF